MNESSPNTKSECFSDLPDPGVDRTKKHKIVDVLIIGLSAFLDNGSVSLVETFSGF